MIGVIDGDRDHLTSLELDADPGVDRVVPVSSPYKLAHKNLHGDAPNAVEVAGVAFGGPDADFRLIPARAPSSRAEQTLGRRAHAPPPARTCCAAARSSRAPARTPSRASASRASRSSREAREETGPADRHRADGPARHRRGRRSTPTCVQVGARNMQHFPLLTELGRAGMPVLLKRGMGASVDELPARRGVHPHRGQLAGDPLRARDPRRRDADALTPGPRVGHGAEGAHAPAGDRRPLARRRAGAPREPLALRRRRRAARTG